MTQPISADALVSDATNRTARGAAQNTVAGALVTLFVYFAFERGGDQLPAAVVGAMIVVVAAVLTFVQNIVENRIGKGFLKKVPAEPQAAVEEEVPVAPAPVYPPAPAPVTPVPPVPSPVTPVTPVSPAPSPAPHIDPDPTFIDPDPTAEGPSTGH